MGSLNRKKAIFSLFIIASIAMANMYFNASKKQNDLRLHGVSTIAHITEKFEHRVSGRSTFDTTIPYLKYRFKDKKNNIYYAENAVYRSVYDTTTVGTTTYVRYSAIDPNNSELDIAKPEAALSFLIFAAGFFVVGAIGLFKSRR